VARAAVATTVATALVATAGTTVATACAATARTTTSRVATADATRLVAAQAGAVIHLQKAPTPELRSAVAVSLSVAFTATAAQPGAAVSRSLFRQYAARRSRI